VKFVDQVISDKNFKKKRWELRDKEKRKTQKAVWEEAT